MVICIKFNSDKYDSNESFAIVGGIDTVEMNLMEHLLLYELDFNIFVPQNVFKFIKKQINSFSYDRETHQFSFKKERMKTKELKTATSAVSASIPREDKKSETLSKTLKHMKSLENLEVNEITSKTGKKEKKGKRIRGETESGNLSVKTAEPSAQSEKQPK